MGILDKLKAAFGGSGRGRDDGLYVYIRCDRCGDVVRVRINMANELQQQFAEGDGVDGYSLRKGVVDARCFRPMEMTMTFDSGRRELGRDVEGGRFVDQAAYDTARAERVGEAPERADP